MPKKSKPIGIKIKAARTRAGLSRHALMMNLKALGLDITEATIYNWERGQTMLDADELFTMAKALNVPLNFFYS